MMTKENAPYLRFAGYAALFDRLDRGGDVIMRGAFTESLKKQGQLPILWQHNPAHCIGWSEYLAEDRRGLRVIARIWDDGVARQLRQLASNAPMGLSFGYRAEQVGQNATTAPSPQQPRRILQRVHIAEISLVNSPMQPKAQVHGMTHMKI